MRVVLLLLQFLSAHAQQMRVQNGSLLLEIPGATLTLSAAGEDAASGAMSVASQQDLAAAIQNTISTVQPQVIKLCLSCHIKSSIILHRCISPVAHFNELWVLMLFARTNCVWEWHSRPHLFRAHILYFFQCSKLLQITLIEFRRKAGHLHPIFVFHWHRSPMIRMP